MLVEIPPASPESPALGVAASPRPRAEGPSPPRRSPRKASPMKELWRSLSEDDESQLPLFVDHHDPVFDPELDDQEHTEFCVREFVLDDAALKDIVEPMLNEYLESDDLGELLDSLRDLNFGDSRYRLPELVLRLGLDHKDADRELCSQLLSELRLQHLIDGGDLETAFDGILGSLDDLKLDTPDAPAVIGCFIARAVADDALAPAFVMRHVAAESESGSALAAEAITKAHALLRMRGGMSRLDTVWGIHGARQPVAVVKEQIALLLEEFLTSGDIAEAERCLRSLEAPHFSHELVYSAVRLAMERSVEDREHLLTLLFSFSDSNLVTPNQFESGFRRIFADLSDIKLDVPAAHAILSEILLAALERGVVQTKLLAESPCRTPRKRYLSENVSGRVKA